MQTERNKQTIKVFFACRGGLGKKLQKYDIHLDGIYNTVGQKMGLYTFKGVL